MKQETTPKIVREENWKKGFHIYQDGGKKQLKALFNESLYYLALYYEDENDVSILRELLTKKGGYIPKDTSYNEEKNEAETTTSKEIMRTDIPQEEWAKIIRQESIKEIINIVDKRNEYDKKLAYYERKTLIEELKELLNK